MSNSAHWEKVQEDIAERRSADRSMRALDLLKAPLTELLDPWPQCCDKNLSFCGLTIGDTLGFRCGECWKIREITL